MKRLGLIVNPVAGLGGRVGLKGSDGVGIQAQARRLGAKPQSHLRALVALKRLKEIQPNIQVLTYAGEMGENCALAGGIAPIIVGRPNENQTTPEDTIKAAQILRQREIDLLLFAGGDGTARDIYTAIGTSLPVLGIPSGVKIHSAAYAINPRVAGELAADYFYGKNYKLREVEVMDIDEEAFRHGTVTPRLFGYLLVPYREGFIQSGKAPSRVSESAILEAIAQEIIDQMDEKTIFIIGPGTTTRPILQRMGLEKTLLGIDVVFRRSILTRDANESDLLQLLDDHPAKIVITPIGGQGYILGRGNQQLSPAVLRRVTKDDIFVVSTLNKLLSLQGRPLLVDTGDLELDQSLSGYKQVIVGYHDRIVYKIGG